MDIKTRQAAIEGWFIPGDDRTALVGSRCRECGTYSFPKETFFCKNPSCTGTEHEQVELSRRGRIWSFTNNCYQPPAPYVATTDPFEPFAVAAVELAEERLVVLGQMVSGTSIEDLHAGMEVELVTETLFEDDEAVHLIWKWCPVCPAISDPAPMQQSSPEDPTANQSGDLPASPGRAGS